MKTQQRKVISQFTLAFHSIRAALFNKLGYNNVFNTFVMYLDFFCKIEVKALIYLKVHLLTVALKSTQVPWIPKVSKIQIQPQKRGGIRPPYTTPFLYLNSKTTIQSANEFF